MLAPLMLAAGAGEARDVPLIASLERLAKNDNAEAIYHLGMAYQTGSGVAEDRVQALAAFRRSAALGDPLGAYKLGCYYAGQGAGLVSSDRALALRYKLVAAEAGYALAQQDVGLLYIKGGDGPTGLAWLQKSAAQGLPGGLVTLAWAYQKAPNVPHDKAKSAAYFRLYMARSSVAQNSTAEFAKFEGTLSAAESEQAANIVDSYRPVPTPLTLKALSGQRAAQRLVGNAPGID